MPDYIPDPDPAFNTWQANFLTVVGGTPGNYGLVAGDLSAANLAQTAWAAAYPAHLDAPTAAQSARQGKDDARALLESSVRLLVRRIQASASVSAAAKTAAGITVPDTIPTAPGPPTTAPIATVDTSERLQHTIHFRDSTTPNSRAKPAGVRGCEIWMKIGTPAPVDPSELTFVTLDTRTPHLTNFDGSDAGKLVTYWLRWISTRDEKGPWSPAVAATIPG